METRVMYKQGRGYCHIPIITMISMISFLVFAGCSTPMPLSESLMFRQAKNPTSNVPKNTVALTGAMNMDGAFIRRYIHVHHSDANDRDILDPARKAGGISVLLINSNDLGINFSVGYKMLGLNTTFPLVGRNYLTLNAGALSGVEAIFQRPLLDKRFTRFGIGLAGGVYARYDTFYHWPGGITGLLVPDGFSSYGFRTVIQLAGVPDGLLHGFYGIGYAPHLKHTLMFMGLAVRMP